MPGVEIETVILDANVEDPLENVLAQVSPGGRGPVMLLGLEAASSSTVQFHPVLQLLNLQRSDWPLRLPRPVVLWVPEYILRFLGKESPDFLDWRSDTFYFAEPQQMELQALDAGIWMQGFDGRLSQKHRHARIAELRSRLTLLPETTDSSVLSTKADWLTELGNHYAFLGHLGEAEQMHRAALKIGEEIGDQQGKAANLHQLGNICFTRGDFDQALNLYMRALEIEDNLGNLGNVAAACHQIGAISARRGEYEQALGWYSRALQISESLGDLSGTAAVYHQLGLIEEAKGNSDSSLDYLLRALRIEEKLGDLGSMAGSYHQIGVNAESRGDYGQALAWYRKSLEISESLGYRMATAATYHHMGAVSQKTGNFGEAFRWYEKALQLAQEIGDKVGEAMVSGQMGALLTELGRIEEGLPLTAKSALALRDLESPNFALGLRWLRRQRDALGECEFLRLLEKSLGEREMRAVLEAVADSSANEV